MIFLQHMLLENAINKHQLKNKVFNWETNYFRSELL